MPFLLLISSIVKHIKNPRINRGFSCDSDRIQTCNLLIRSQMLYSVELRSHSVILCLLNDFVTPTGFKPVTF